MKTKNTHVIAYYIWNHPEKRSILLSRNYNSGLFNPFAKKWFENEVLHRFPTAKKISDKTLNGFHFEIQDLIFELQ